MQKKYIKKQKFITNFILFSCGVVFLIIGLVAIWISQLVLPDFRSFNERQVVSSTKIFDRTGEVLLYDVYKDIKRTPVNYEDISVNIKNATVAIEDSEFWNHRGIRIKSIMRAVWANLTGKKIQGGSTITQQVVKNALLTQEKSITRKIKEWIISVKIEKTMSKEDILLLYLNNNPYGGNLYGVKEGSLFFFGKEPKDVTMAEAAYLAAVPNGPTYFSPYGKNRDKLEDRKNLVLKRMFDLGFIQEEEYNKALAEEVVFKPEPVTGIKAPHFVFFVKDYLEKKYGPDMVLNGGLRVITTLDYELQEKAEEIALTQAKINEKSWNGKNTGIVVMESKTGQILSMVGSRNYFDKEIDGNYNVATAERQPGSSFKPIVYALAFEKGFTEKTTLFDVKTEFNATCNPYGSGESGGWNTACYTPDNYDNAFRGPMTLRNALAQSINLIAVKLLYLVGVTDSIKMAHDLGITTLNDPDRYGLSLVIGGGETTLLDMTSAYSVFANEGEKHPYQMILSVSKENNEILEEYQDKKSQILKPNTTRILSSILSDNIARTPTFGSNSTLVIPGREVAVKTGTTNSNRDAWTIGYTPSVVVGVWVGNNDNTPMKKGGAAMAGPIWNKVMSLVLKNYPKETFNKPDPIDPNLPSVLRGIWQGGEVVEIDTVSGGLATDLTPDEFRKEIAVTEVHNILHWLNKDNILDPSLNGRNDSQYKNWEYAVSSWWSINGYKYANSFENYIPNFYDDIHTEKNQPVFQIEDKGNQFYKKDELVYLKIKAQSKYQINKIDIYINDLYIKSIKSPPYDVSFYPSSISNIANNNTLKIIGYDVYGNKGDLSFQFSVKD